jgi:hypothetical protein
VTDLEKEPKFTKGPWKVKPKGKHWNNKELDHYDIENEVGECFVDNTYGIENANLIACAPELYAMLERFVLFEIGYDDYEEAKALLKRARGE